MRRPESRIALSAICLAGFLMQLDVTIVNVALPSIQRELGATPGDLVWVISGYALSLATTIPVVGALGDRWGHRRVLQAGLAWFGLCSVAAALAPGAGWLIAARIGQGVGGAAMLALTLAVLNDVFPLERRGSAIGWWAALGGTGFGAGPVVGGVLLGLGRWPAIFWINVSLVALAMLLIARAIPGSDAGMGPVRRPLDVAGALLAMVGVGAVTFGLIGFRWVPMLAGVLVLGILVVQQRSARDLLVPAPVHRDRVFVIACLVYFTSYLAFSGTLYFVTLLFQNLRGWSPLRTGLSWLFMNVPFLVVAQAAGRLRERFSAARMVAAGCGVAAVGTAVLAALGATTPFPVAAIGYLIAGTGFGLLVPGVTQVAMSELPAALSGAASAVLNSSRQLGTATGLAVVGAVGAAVTARFSFEWGYQTALGFCVLGLLVAMALTIMLRPKRGGADQGQAMRVVAGCSRGHPGAAEHPAAHGPRIGKTCEQ